MAPPTLPVFYIQYLELTLTGHAVQVPTLMTAATPSQEEKVLLWPETFTEPKLSTEPTIQEGEEPPPA